VGAYVDSFLLCDEHGQKNNPSRPYLRPFVNRDDQLLNRSSRRSYIDPVRLASFRTDGKEAVAMFDVFASLCDVASRQLEGGDEEATFPPLLLDPLPQSAYNLPQLRFPSYKSLIRGVVMVPCERWYCTLRHATSVPMLCGMI
jgi:hypothetical protein